MKPILILVAAMGLAACITDPTRDFHCVYAGDTVGVVSFHDDGNVITSCRFIVQREQECRPEINSRRLFRASDCIVGTTDNG